MFCCVFFFFFQAEDGIRDYKVTGVQTCALPISSRPRPRSWRRTRSARGGRSWCRSTCGTCPGRRTPLARACTPATPRPRESPTRSEERRVGKEDRFRKRQCNERKKRVRKKQINI